MKRSRAEEVLGITLAKTSQPLVRILIGHWRRISAADAESCGDRAAERADIVESSNDLLLGGSLKNRCELPVETDEEIRNFIGPTRDGLCNRHGEGVDVGSRSEIFVAPELRCFRCVCRTLQDRGIDPCR